MNAAADAAFERESVWPPGTLWERFETGQAAALLPFGDGERAPELLAKFPSGHPYREIAAIPAQFASHLSGTPDQMSAFALARLHGAWARGVMALRGGEQELASFLIERIEAHGGVCALDRRAEKLVLKNGTTAGVVLDGDEEPTGATSVISDQWGEALADLSGGAGLTRAAERDWPRLVPETAASCSASWLPTPCCRIRCQPSHSSCLRARRAIRADRLVHLQRVEPPPRTQPARAGETLLIAECLLPARSALTLMEAREAVLETLRTALLPFLDQHTARGRFGARRLAADRQNQRPTA